MVLALYLVPFAGIAFLWFIGVVRDRIGAAEDRFFATVFLGTGLLFVAMLFVAAAVAGALIAAEIAGSGGSPRTSGGSAAQTLPQVLTVYAMRMAGMFAIVTTTIAMRLGLFPRWLAVFGMRRRRAAPHGRVVPWAVMLFPLWVLVLSVHLLLHPPAAHAAQTAT